MRLTDVHIWHAQMHSGGVGFEYLELELHDEAQCCRNDDSNGACAMNMTMNMMSTSNPITLLLGSKNTESRSAEGQASHTSTPTLLASDARQCLQGET